MRALTLLFIGLLVSHCSYEPAEPGLCKLNCKKASITGSDSVFRIVKKSLDQNVTCGPESAGQDLSEPFVAQFVVGESFQGNATGGGEAAEELRPVPFASFEPIVNGLRSEDPARSPNVTQVGDTFTPARYKGIVTPKDNWCSDTCGVATVEVYGRCPAQGAESAVTVQIHSGALYSDDENTAVFTVNTLEPE